jgi:hypothetical protein
MLRKILEQPPIGRGSASELQGAGCPGNLKTEIDMPELRESASSHKGQPTGLASHRRNRGDDLAAKAALMLTRYPAEVREQIADFCGFLQRNRDRQKTGFDR